MSELRLEYKNTSALSRRGGAQVRSAMCAAPLRWVRRGPSTSSARRPSWRRCAPTLACGATKKARSQRLATQRAPAHAACLPPLPRDRVSACGPVCFRPVRRACSLAHARPHAAVRNADAPDLLCVERTVWGRTRGVRRSTHVRWRGNAPCLDGGGKGRVLRSACAGSTPSFECGSEREAGTPSLEEGPQQRWSAPWKGPYFERSAPWKGPCVTTPEGRATPPHDTQNNTRSLSRPQKGTPRRMRRGRPVASSALWGRTRGVTGGGHTRRSLDGGAAQGVSYGQRVWGRPRPFRAGPRGRPAHLPLRRT